MQSKISPKTHEKHTMNSLTSLIFHSTPSIPFTFRYPVGWQTREIVRDDDAEVFIAGPRNEADTYSVTLSIRLRTEPFLTPEAAAADFLEHYETAFGFEQIAQGPGMAAGRLAQIAEIRYTMLLPFNSLDAELTTIREQRIFFQSHGELVTLIYAAPDELFAQLAAGVSHLDKHVCAYGSLQTRDRLHHHQPASRYAVARNAARIR